MEAAGLTLPHAFVTGSAVRGPGALPRLQAHVLAAHDDLEVYLAREQLTIQVCFV